MGRVFLKGVRGGRIGGHNRKFSKVILKGVKCRNKFHIGGNTFQNNILHIKQGKITDNLAYHNYKQHYRIS